jgi:hypothetical protein
MISAVMLALTQVVSTAPPIECEIILSTWCIVELPSTVSMQDNGRQREWKITLSENTIAGVVTIVEDKFCGGPLSNSFRIVAEEQQASLRSLSESSCGLTFRVSGPAALHAGAVVGLTVMVKGNSGWLSPKEQ